MSDQQCPAPSATFDQSLFRSSVLQVQEDFAILGLLGSLYGVVVVLSALSIHALTQRGSTRKQATTIVLCLTIFALFTSTTIYVITCMLSCQYIFLKAFISSGYALWSYSVDLKFPYAPLALVEAYDYSRLHSCTSTAAITINITLGDAIVCWRACVVWYRNRAVRAILCAFLLATFVLGVADTAWSCHASYRVMSLNFYSFVPLGTTFEGLPIGIAACALSLATNLLATLLVGMKAWELRRSLRGYLVAGPRRAQVQKLLALLIESGAVYCAIWGVVVAFQVSEYQVGQPGATPLASGFLNTFNVVMTGALIPLIAIYPAFIIVLVALNRSHIEKGLTQGGQCEPSVIRVPTPHIAVTIDMASENMCEGGTSPSRWRHDVLVIGGLCTFKSGESDGSHDQFDSESEIAMACT